MLARTCAACAARRLSCRLGLSCVCSPSPQSISQAKAGLDVQLPSEAPDKANHIRSPNLFVRHLSHPSQRFLPSRCCASRTRHSPHHTSQFQRCRWTFTARIAGSSSDLTKTSAKPQTRHVGLEFINCMLVCTFHWLRPRQSSDHKTNPNRSSCRLSQLIVWLVQVTVLNGNRWNRGFYVDAFGHVRCNTRDMNTACPLAVGSSQSVAVGTDGATTFFTSALSSTSSGTAGPLLLQLPRLSTSRTSAPQSGDITFRNSSPSANGNSL